MADRRVIRGTGYMGKGNSSEVRVVSLKESFIIFNHVFKNGREHLIFLVAVILQPICLSSL